MQIGKVDYRSRGATRQFVESLHQTGFAVLSCHPISKALMDEAYQDWQQFFESDEKFKYQFDPQVQSGYFPFRSENSKDSAVKDLKEFFHLYPFTPMPVNLGSSTLRLREQLISMAHTLLSWIQDHSPQEVLGRFSEPLPEMVAGSTGNLLRILHYPPLKGEVEPGAVRAASHEDINIITLLPAATMPGLQVMGMDGNWYEVPCDPGSIVINSGDMLQVASGGFFKSTTHRVVNPTGEAALVSRYSMPFFVHPREEVRLNERYLAKDYLLERLRELGLK